LCTRLRLLAMQTPGGCVGHLNGRMEDKLEKVLPQDAAEQSE